MGFIILKVISVLIGYIYIVLIFLLIGQFPSFWSFPSLMATGNSA